MLLHQTFCLYLPADAGVYGKACQTDADCAYKGVNYGIACWDNGNGKPVCSGRGFIKNTSCDPSVCTFQYGYLGSKAWQPRYAQCTDVVADSDKCIGDDTVHQVLPKAYTWPNDPQVFGGDAPLYRIVFAPGGTNVPVTPSVGQANGELIESGIPLCRLLYQRSWRVTDVSPVAHSDGCDPVWVCDEVSPSGACGVNDGVVVFEHGV